MTMKLVSFLEKAAKAAIEKLVSGVVEGLAKAKSISDTEVAKISATVQVLKVMKMTEELRLFSVIVMAECGRLGTLVPTAIAQLFASPAFAPAPQPVVAQSAPAPKPGTVLSPKLGPIPVQKYATPAKPVPAVLKPTAPARTIKPVQSAEFNSTNALKTWLGQLGGIVKNGNAPWKVVQGTTARLFKSGVKLTSDQWQLLFAAMKAAHECGQHIVNNDAKPAELFATAPAEMVDDYLFGQDGILPSLTGEVSDLYGPMPEWLCAKCSIVLDAIKTVDDRQKLGEQEVARLDNFLKAIESKNPPRWLFEKGRNVWGAEEDTPFPPANCNGNGNGNSNGSELDSDTEVWNKAVAKSTATAFTQAVANLS